MAGDAILTDYIRPAFRVGQSEISEVDTEYQSLDRKLLAAIFTIAEAKGDATRLLLNKQEELSKQGRVLRGIESMRMILGTYSIDNETSIASSITSLVTMPTGGCLKTYLGLFRSQLIDLDPNISSSMLEPILRERLEGFPELKNEMSRYSEKRAKRRTLEALMLRLDKYMSQKSQRENRKLANKSYGTASLKP